MIDDRPWDEMVVARALFIAARYREADVCFDTTWDTIRQGESSAYEMVLRSRFPDLVEDLEAEWAYEASHLPRRQL